MGADRKLSGESAPPLGTARDGRAVAIKFCGLTRTEDALRAAELGAAYAGVIFAGGPRLLTPDRAVQVLAPVPPGVRRVGVFGEADAALVGEVARDVGLDVVQLHADPSPDFIDDVRQFFAGEVWGVLRTASSELPGHAADLFAAAHAVVLDAKVPGALGGTGVALDWAALRGAVDDARAGAAGRLVLAGGLTPENVASAVGALAPDVVDVSSGVERGPGVKDHARMAAFAAAVP